MPWGNWLGRILCHGCGSSTRNEYFDNKVATGQAGAWFPQGPITGSIRCPRCQRNGGTNPFDLTEETAAELQAKYWISPPQQQPPAAQLSTCDVARMPPPPLPQPQQPPAVQLSTCDVAHPSAFGPYGVDMLFRSEMPPSPELPPEEPPQAEEPIRDLVADVCELRESLGSAMELIRVLEKKVCVLEEKVRGYERLDPRVLSVPPRTA